MTVDVFWASESVRRAASLVLRGLTLIARFGLLFVIALYLTPEQVALYGLLFATIAYGVLVAGFDFYAFAIRELIGAERSRWNGIARNYGAFSATAYCVVIPMSALLFAFGLLPWEVAAWFVVLLILEHLSQELYRVLIATGCPLTAAVVLFLRWGAWVLVVVAFMGVVPETRTLSFALGAWAIGAAASCVVGVASLRWLEPRRLIGPVDWAWIWRGMKLATLYFISTLCWRAVYVTDRYWIEAAGGAEVLAAYVLYVGFTNAITGFLEASVFSFIYPQIVRAAGERDRAAYRRNMRRLTWQTIGITGALAAAVLVLSKPVITLLGEDVYVEQYSLLVWSLLGVVFFCFSMVPHFGLYAWHRDKPIIASQIFVLPLFVTLSAVLVPWLGPQAVPAAIAGSFLMVYLFKQVAYALVMRRVWSTP